MSNLPQVTPKKLVKFFLKQGFVIKRQVGSHARLEHLDGRKITIAIHNKPIAPGTFQSILRQAKMTRDEFIKLFKSLLGSYSPRLAARVSFPRKRESRSPIKSGMTT